MVASFSAGFSSDPLLQAANVEDALAMVTVITDLLGLYTLDLLTTKLHLPCSERPEQFLRVKGIQGKEQKRNKIPTFVFAVSGSCPFLPH